MGHVEEWVVIDGCIVVGAESESNDSRLTGTAESDLTAQLSWEIGGDSELCQWAAGKWCRGGCC